MPTSRVRFSSRSRSQHAPILPASFTGRHPRLEGRFILVLILYTHRLMMLGTCAEDLTTRSRSTYGHSVRRCGRWRRRSRRSATSRTRGSWARSCRGCASPRYTHDPSTTSCNCARGRAAHDQTLTTFSTYVPRAADVSFLFVGGLLTRCAQTPFIRSPSGRQAIVDVLGECQAVEERVSRRQSTESSGTVSRS